MGCGSSSPLIIHLNSNEKRIIRQTWEAMDDQDDVMYVHIFAHILRASHRIRRVHLCSPPPDASRAWSEPEQLYHQANQLGNFLDKIIVELKLHTYKVAEVAFHLGMRHFKFKDLGYSVSDLPVFMTAIAGYFKITRNVPFSEEDIFSAWYVFLDQVAQIMTAAFKATQAAEIKLNTRPELPEPEPALPPIKEAEEVEESSASAETTSEASSKPPSRGQPRDVQSVRSKLSSNVQAQPGKPPPPPELSSISSGSGSTTLSGKVRRH